MNRIISDDEKLKIWELRRSYKKSGLVENTLPEDPVKLLRIWIKQAITSKVAEPNAMSLATVTEEGNPNVRTVLLKEIEKDAITFYTNYKSSKAKELEHHPVASCCFWWPELERQLRLSGSVEKISRKESAAYFASRPRESQIGAWASDQSRIIESRDELERQVKRFQDQFEGQEVSLPDSWGGYRIFLSGIEFWQGRPGRLHDRIQYSVQAGLWIPRRLSP